MNAFGKYKVGIGSMDEFWFGDGFDLPSTRNDEVM